MQTSISHHFSPYMHLSHRLVVYHAEPNVRCHRQTVYPTSLLASRVHSESLTVTCPCGSDTPSRDYASGDRGCKYGGASIGASCRSREHWWGNGWRLCSTKHLRHPSILPPQWLHNAEAVLGQSAWTRYFFAKTLEQSGLLVVKLLSALHARLNKTLQMAFKPHRSTTGCGCQE